VPAHAIPKIPAATRHHSFDAIVLRLAVVGRQMFPHGEGLLVSVPAWPARSILAGKATRVAALSAPSAL